MTVNPQSVSDRVASLSPAKRILLARRLSEHAQPASNTRKLLVAYWNGTATEQELRAFLVQQLPEYMHPNVLMSLGKLPRTAVGKLDYQGLPLPTALPDLRSPIEEEESSPVEKMLRDIWLDVLRVSDVQGSDNFFGLGGDSILGLQVVSRGRREGLELAPRDIFAFDTLAELAAAVTQRAGANTSLAEKKNIRQAVEFTHEKILPPAPDTRRSSDKLTPIEHWFFGLDFDARQHWNMPMLMAVRPGIDVSHLEQAVAQVTLRHPELSCSFRQEQVGWVRVSNPPAACTFDIYDFRDLAPAESTEARASTVKALQRSLDLQRGLLFRGAYFRCSDQQDILLLLAHHLCVDGVTWRCLLDEIEEIYAALSERRDARLDISGASYVEWADALVQTAQDKAFGEERSYWLRQKTATPVVLPTDYAAERNLEGDAAVARASLSPEETAALLQRAHSAYQTNVTDLLVAALSRSILPWADADELSIMLEYYGRDVAVLNCDVSSATGWFTSVFPLRIERESDSLAQLLRSTKERLRSVPNGGVGYGVLRYLDPVPANRDSLIDDRPSQLALNYFGQIDAMTSTTLFTGMVDGALTSARSPTAPRAAVFEVQVMVADGALHIDWIYSSKLHRAVTAKALLDSYVLTLRELLAHCLAPGSGSYTPSDFPKADLDQDDLDDLIEGLD